MKKLDYKLTDYKVHVSFGGNSATLSRRPDEDGQCKVSFSIPVNKSHADLINSSGIAQVSRIDEEKKTIYFVRESFYETHLMSEIIADILMKYENENA